MIIRLFCAFGAAFSTWFFKIIPIKQETDQELTLKRFELYKNLYFNLLINFDLKYWMCYADFFTLYIEHLENKNQEIYLLLDPLSRKYIKNTSAYFKRVQKEKEIKNKLRDLGAIYVSMTGSGSAVYGLFHHPVEAEKAFPEYFVWQSE